MTYESSLSGTVALITGGARGIGAATARALASRGAKVHISDVLSCDAIAEEITDTGGMAEAHHLDITQSTHCVQLAQQIVESDQTLDILVANAGVCPKGTVAGDREQWRSVLDINLNGTQNCVEAVWPHMADQQRGRLVLVSSMAFYQGGLIVGTEYSASKAAIIGMTRHLARNGGPEGILVNAVAPGIIDTPMTEDFNKPELEKIPLGRYGTAEDVAGPISFLCGPESAYMTGTVLNVTGGMVLAA